MSKPIGPPASISVAWCATCKNVITCGEGADRVIVCPYCRHGYGRVKIVKYIRMMEPNT